MEPATRTERFFARLIDGVLYAVPSVLFTENLGSGMAQLGSVLFLGLLGFQFRLLARDGQSIGKRAVKIRIVGVDSGANDGFAANVLKRTVLSGLLNLLPLYFLADSLMIFRRDRRCAHDLIAGTRVVKV